MSDLITEVSKYVKGWTGGLPETPCGAGSSLVRTKQQRQWIPGIIKKYGIKTVADIGAGDLNWIKKIDLSGVEYTAYDLVPRQPGVIKFDLIHEIPPRVDLIMCLWVLNHLPIEHSRQAIKNLKASGSKYLMMTDRLSYRANQPVEIDMPYIEYMPIYWKDDASIRLIRLC